MTVFIASSAFILAQMNSMSGAAAQQTSPTSPNYSQQMPSPVGPGTVNYVEGQVQLAGTTLSPQSVGSATLQAGQTLTTGDGYAEVLLTPGAFLRAGHNSDIRMLSAGLADTRVEVNRGQAILEVDQLIDGTSLAVSMNGSATQIVKKGLYAFNADSQTIRVLDGKAKLQSEIRTETLGKHDEVALTGDHAFKKRNFNDKVAKEDPLYVWSKARSQDEAQASVGSASDADAYASVGSGWYWDPALNYYGFWPASGWLSSPFGWGFYSPAYFGGYYGGGYGWYGRPAWHEHHEHSGWHGNPGWHGHSGWHGNPGTGMHNHLGGVNARAGGFHGGGFHGGGGGFHGGGGRGGGHH